MDQCATVLFTDESRFSLNTNSCRTFKWRKPGIRYLPSNVREIGNYGARGLIVWADIMLDGRIPLHVFKRDSVTGVRYRDEVLEPYVCFFRGACGSGFILLDDNVRPHRALLVDEFLESEDISRMDWPARSPYLNTIQQRSYVKAVSTKCLGGPPVDRDRLSAHPGYTVCIERSGEGSCNSQPPPRTIQEMKTASLNEWNQLPYSKFCDVWFLLESVARVAAIVGDHHSAIRLSIDSKILWMCSWGTADQAASTSCQS
ncbi:transposable element Tc1 transposase [Trichonephila clavipes]|nr:transposable element Tc1 transposase [Trichonephila clavipes]